MFSPEISTSAFEFFSLILKCGNHCTLEGTQNARRSRHAFVYGEASSSFKVRLCCAHVAYFVRWAKGTRVAKIHLMKQLDGGRKDDQSVSRRR